MRPRARARRRLAKGSALAAAVAALWVTSAQAGGHPVPRPRAERVNHAPAQVVRPDGFDWADAASGLGLGLGISLLVAAAAVSRRDRHRLQDASQNLTQRP